VPANGETAKIVADDCDFLAAIVNVEPMREKVRLAVERLDLPKTPFVDVLSKIIEGVSPDTIYAFDDETARQMYTAATSQTPPEPERAEILVEKRLARLERDALREESARLQEAIRRAENENDSARVMELLPQKMSIDRRIQELGAA
jgi:LPS O-antigen subunit length determinant protein (WzzB/FepE family)